MSLNINSYISYIFLSYHFLFKKYIKKSQILFINYLLVFKMLMSEVVVNHFSRYPCIIFSTRLHFKGV